MDWWIIGLLLLFGMFVLLSTGMPVAFAIGLLAVIGMFFLGGGIAGLSGLALVGYRGLFSFTLIAIPLFILMAELLMYTGLIGDLFDTAQKWLGRLPGGLAVSSVGACAVFAAITGSGIANCAAIGSVAIPEMLKRGYNKELATGCVASAGTLGIVIPPSILMVMFGMIAEVSVGKLFMAGFFPGFLMATMYALYIVIRAMVTPGFAPVEPPITWKERFLSLRRTWVIIGVGASVLVLIYTGICTPTESAAVGAFFAFVLTIVFKRLTWVNLRDAAVRTVQVTAMLCIILVAAYAFSRVLSYSLIPQKLSEALVSLQLPPLAIVILMQVMLAVLACFMDPGSIMLITSPIFVPIVISLGFDPIWYGVLFLMNMEIGGATPPFGIALFVVKGISPPEVTMNDIIRGIFPFVFMAFTSIAIVIAFPQIALWLPGTMR